MSFHRSSLINMYLICLVCMKDFFYLWGGLSDFLMSFCLHVGKKMKVYSQNDLQFLNNTLFAFALTVQCYCLCSTVSNTLKCSSKSAWHLNLTSDLFPWKWSSGFLSAMSSVQSQSGWCRHGDTDRSSTLCRCRWGRYETPGALRTNTDTL